MRNLEILSLGLGVQSTALYFMSSMGILPPIDYAIFADPGKEKNKTYEYLQWLLKWQKENNGVPIIIKKERNLFKDLLNSTNHKGKRFSSIPAFTIDENGQVGMLNRQCTSEYKIYVVDNAIRDLYGLNPRDRRPETRVWKGITSDEMDRASKPYEAWKVSVYPFLGFTISKKKVTRMRDSEFLQMNRMDVIAWYNKNGLPLPPKSSCIFCPYQSEQSWIDLKENNAEDFEAACLVDEAIRDSTTKGIKQPIYLHRSCKPLREINFDRTQPDIPFGECSSECGRR